jgi:hypothetical protein
MSPAIGIGIGTCFGGGAPAKWTPKLLAPTQWLRSDLGVTLAGSDVAAWADQSGNGYGVSNSADRPSYDTSGSIPKLVFDGVTERLYRPALPTPSAYTYSMVFKATRDGNDIIIDSDASSGWWIGSGSATEFYCFHAGGAKSRKIADADTLTNCDVQWDGSSLRARSNGGSWSTVSGATSLPSVSSNFSIGAYFNGAYPTPMELWEFVYWGSVVSDPNLAKLRAYMLARYGV